MERRLLATVAMCAAAAAALGATGWYDVVDEVQGANTAAPTLSVSITPHGQAPAAGKRVTLQATSHVPSPQIDLGCAIPFARSTPSDVTLVVYVDDLKLIVCPRG